jgi:hypothetical protein
MAEGDLLHNAAQPEQQALAHQKWQTQPYLRMHPRAFGSTRSGAVLRPTSIFAFRGNTDLP